MFQESSLWKPEGLNSTQDLTIDKMAQCTRSDNIGQARSKMQDETTQAETTQDERAKPWSDRIDRTDGVRDMDDVSHHAVTADAPRP